MVVHVTVIYRKTVSLRSKNFKNRFSTELSREQFVDGLEDMVMNNAETSFFVFLFLLTFFTLVCGFLPLHENSF